VLHVVEIGEAKLLPPPLPPPLRIHIQWGYPPLTLSPPDGWHSWHAFSLSAPTTFYCEHGSPPTSSRPRSSGCSIVRCGHPRDPVQSHECDENIKSRKMPKQIQIDLPWCWRPFLPRWQGQALGLVGPMI
jgi:hypothetical protein